jgi:16S rRNA G966 N2-methylase RsmD
MQLVKYETARHALQVAQSVDEVKAIRDKMEALRAYAKQSKDFEMSNFAAEIRIRAERRMGEMLKAQKEAGEMNKGGGDRKSDGYHQSHDETSDIPTLSQIGISKSMSSRSQIIASVPENEFEAAISECKASMKELSGSTIQRLIKNKKKEEKIKRKAANPGDIGDHQLHVGNFTDIEIPEASVDVIVTDPPYPKEYLPLYGELAEFSAQVLKPGGSLVVMCGLSYLPEILKDMGQHIRYQWMLSYLTLGSQSPQIFTRRVVTFWKPLLWFVKGDYTGDWISDVCQSVSNDKDHHKWGQSISGMTDIVDRFSDPGDIVLDPFCGGGTTGVVAAAMNRQFIGIDCDPGCIETTKRRIYRVKKS